MPADLARNSGQDTSSLNFLMVPGKQKKNREDSAVFDGVARLSRSCAEKPSDFCFQMLDADLPYKVFGCGKQPITRSICQNSCRLRKCLAGMCFFLAFDPDFEL